VFLGTYLPGQEPLKIEELTRERLLRFSRAHRAYFGCVSAATGSQRLAMGSLALFFIAGGIILAWVRIPSSERS
jgi:hypothetical protein